jgi:hypothetical protein
LELILFQTLDGSNTWYGQSHKPITAHPFKEAGINEFDPIQLFKISTNFLTTDQVSEFHWLSLLELNDDFFPFHWSSEEEWRHYLLGDTISTLPVMYTGPRPSSAPMYSTPTIPPLSILTQSIILSSINHFFISHSTGPMTLASGNLSELHCKNPCPCTHQASKMVVYLVEFCISHPADLWYNAINTSIWLQYHTLSEHQSPLSTMDTHLIRPSDSLEDSTTQHKLLPCCKLVNLTHQDIFIHSPFQFVTVNGRKTQDHISQPDWDVFKAYCGMFHNPLPQFDAPSYSIHVDPGAHVTIQSDTIAR